MTTKQKIYFVVLLILSAIGIGLLGYCTNRADTCQLVLLFGLLFGLYYLLVRHFKKQWSISMLIGWALVLRLVLCLQVPNLSDDYFRFAWDGRLLAHGINPYLTLPSEIKETALGKSANLTSELYNGLNSGSYYSVYPPVHQAAFAFASYLFPNSLFGNILCLRLILLLSECGVMLVLIRLLRFMKKDPGLVALYAFNPLVILEITGNLHFEGLLILFVLLAILFLMKARTKLSAISLAMAAGVKLLPLIFIPLVISKLGLRKGLLYAVLCAGGLILLFAPFLNRVLISNLFSSINLYFQKFEFNASVYYIFRWAGFLISGYNEIHVIGVMLALLTLLAVLFLAFRFRSRPGALFPQYALLTLLAYFIFATTIHPWYITTLVALGVLGTCRFQYVWSALIVLTYYTYHQVPYAESMVLTTTEYMILGAFLVREWRLGTFGEQPALL